MNELSLHILDICQNSIKANSTLIKIIINEQPKKNIFEITIEDNGSGMNKDNLEQVTNPFFTTRTTRKVGLGVSLFKMAAEMADGSFIINSKENEGTFINATFKYNHIDRAPLGNIAETISVLILSESNVDILYEHYYNEKNYVFNTKEIRNVLEGISFTNYEVITWIKNNIKEGILDIHKEETL